MRKPLLLMSLAGLGACSSLTPIDDPVYLRINDLEARLIRIERVLDNDSLISLAGDISSLRTETQQLLNEVETLRFELENQGTRSRDLYVDLDERLSAIETAQAQMRSMPVTAQGGAPVAAVTDQQAYDTAFALIGQQDWANARSAFERFLATYPVSGLRSNAQYWIAETYYAELQFQTALREFQKVIDEYPQSSKQPDALVKIGFCNFELRNFAASRQALMQVMRQFPDSTYATQAQQRLTQIPQ